jgi:hypothetical protein
VFVGPQEWTTRRVRLNGTDVSHRDITFEAGQAIKSLEVELDKPLIGLRR